MSSKPLSDVLITFKGASHIPIGNFMDQSSDPYLSAQLTPRTPPTSEHPPYPLTFRTSTLRRTRDPEWNETWHLGGIPPEGFELEVKIMDEDKPGDFDDRLGVAYLSVTQLPTGSNDGGAGESQEYTVKVMKRKASRRAYAATYISAWCSGDFKKQRGRVDCLY
jgi:C2 domain